MMTSEQFFGLEKDNPHDHVRWFNKITSTIKYKDVPNSVIKLILFPFSPAGAARRWLEKEPPCSITTWDDLVSKFINEFFPPSRTTNLRNEISNFQQKFDESFHEAWERYKDLLRACPHHGFTEFHQLYTFYNALNPSDQDSLNAAAGGYLLEKSPQDTLTIIENKSKVRNSRSKPIASPVNACDNHSSSELAKLTHAVNQQTSAMNTNTASTSRSGTLPGNTIANPKGELKAITTCSGVVTEGPTIPNPPKSVNPKEDKCVEETYTDPDHAEYTIKVPPPPPEKLQELANTPLNENCLAVILKMLPKKLGDPGKFLIPCRFSELKCKALADLGASINLMPLFVWKKLGLPDLIPTRMTLELANRAICTPDEIARDVFVLVGKFTFLADFVVVDYESDPRVPLILGRPFLRTARALVDVHGKDCLKDLVSHKQSGNPTFSLHKEIASPEVISEFHDSKGSSPEVIYEFHDSKGCTFLSEELPDIDSFNDSHPYFDDDPLSGSTTYSANSLLEEFVDELALISYPPDYDDNRLCDIESDIKEIKFLLFQGKDSNFKDSIDQSVLTHCDDLFVDPTPEMFTDEQPPDYLFLPRFDVYPDDFLEIESDATFDDDSFDSEGEKIKEADLLIDPLDLPCDIMSEEIEFLFFQGEDSDFKDSIDQSVLTHYDDLFVDPTPEMFTEERPPDYSFPPRFDVGKIKEADLLIDQLDLPCDIMSEYDSFNSQDFSRDDVLFSPDNEDKVFNPGILSHEKSVKIITHVTQEKKLAISFASWLVEDFDPPFYELLVFKEVPNSMRLLPFSSKNEEKVFKPGIYTFKKFHCCFLSELSHPYFHVFKINRQQAAPQPLFGWQNQSY
nr:reverse transcriptase domain-containing protein [Tanacetum cinerariifolium]